MGGAADATGRAGAFGGDACLDEEATIGRCVEKALLGIARSGLSGEVIVADNGSTDRSVAIARAKYAR